VATAARRLAFHVLLRAEDRTATLADLLAAPELQSLPPRDRAFAHELVLGTLRQRGALDHALATLVDRPLAGLDLPTLTALRLGAYQILRLRVPDRAAVSEAVDLARDGGRSAGLVNAVLRRLAREGAPPPPDPGRDPLGWLTSAGSLPPWLAARWLSHLGAEGALGRARAFLEPPATAFRLNPRVPDAIDRCAAAGLQPRPLVVPGAWEATAGRVTDLAGEGTIYLQDQGSQMVAHLAAAAGSILDACAAPGGKSTLAADLIGAEGFVVAAEASLRRVRTLAHLVGRWGSSNVRVVAADAERPPFTRRFDVVLLDAPCSGLGTLGRRPDIRWRLTPADIGWHAERQRRLLLSLAPLVKPGGKLVYSVCSAEPEEGELVAQALIEEQSEFHAEPPPAWASAFAEGSAARTSPERDLGDAFYAIVLRRA
jgi:16S rRNA (cytosine967-C5)-methyltransferase